MCEEKDPEVILCLGESKSNSTIYIYIRFLCCGEDLGEDTIVVKISAVVQQGAIMM